MSPAKNTRSSTFKAFARLASGKLIRAVPDNHEIEVMATIARQPNGFHQDVIGFAGYEAADRQHIALW